MADADDNEIKFQEPDPTPEAKEPTEISFESLQTDVNLTKTPDVVREIIKLKKKEEEKKAEKEQIPSVYKESSHISAKHSESSPQQTSGTNKTTTPRSITKPGSVDLKTRPKSKTSISSRSPPLTARKTPDSSLKMFNRTGTGKGVTPRSRNLSSGKIQLSPIQSHNSSSRSSTRSKTFSHPPASPSVSIDVSVREHTKDFEGPACTPCEYQDTFHEANYWCRDCNEALCDACTDHHKSLRMSKTHKLIRISETDEMPFSLKIKENCNFHKNKKYEFFCNEHDVPICPQCVTTTHKFCSDVQTIDDAAQKSLSFTDMKLISEKLKVWTQMVQKLQTQRARNMRELELQKSTIEKEINKFRDDLVKHFDEMKQKSLDELADVYAKNMQEIKRQNEALEERHESLNTMQKDIKMMQHYASQYQVFLGTRELKEKQVMEMQLLKVFEGQFNLVSLEFVVTNFMDLPLKVEKFGLVRSNIKPMPLSLDIKFDKKESKKAAEKPVVTTMPSNIILKSKLCFSIEKGGNFNFIRGGTILPDGRCIMMDHNNKSLIVFSQKGSILDRITFYSCPWEVATLDSDKVALTIPDKKEIVIMETKKFTLVQQIKVSNSCSGIAPLDGRIVAVCEKIGFLILDRTGTIVATLKCDVSGVRYVVAAFGNIYYTDFIRKTVNCIDMSGKSVFRFQNDNLKYPCAITAIRDEFVLVTGYNSKNVIAIAADGKYHEIVLTHRDGLMYPTAIDYCHETSTLMLCTNRRGTVEVFEMT